MQSDEPNAGFDPCRLIAPLDKPQWRLAGTILLFFMAAAIAVFEDQPVLYIALLLALTLVWALAESLFRACRKQREDDYDTKISPIIKFFLRRTDLVLKHRSRVELRILLMRPKGNIWQPVGNSALNPEGMQHLSLPRGELWMYYVDSGEAQAVLLDDTLRDFIPRFVAENDLHLFDEVSTVLVSPIFEPGHVDAEHITAALVVYGVGNRGKILLQAVRIGHIEKICQIMAPLLCYNYVCK